jgi:hypothetical protein
VLLRKDYICKCTDAEGNVSANQDALSAQPGVHHSLQPPLTSVIEGGRLQGEERIQVSFTDGWTSSYSWYCVQGMIIKQ